MASVPDYIRTFEPLWDHWIITDHLGEGGFGNVYKITRTDVSADSSVANAALKWIPIPQNPNDFEQFYAQGMSEQSIARFILSQKEKVLGEIELMGRLRGSSNNVIYEDFFVHERGGGKGFDVFIRMELMKGTLHQQMRSGELPLSAVIKTALDLCNALGDCHAAKILHRDIKPENVFISENGTYKLGDFGIAQIMDDSGVVNAVHSGTNGYMAPEVYNNQPQTRSTDVYSLGLLIYCLLNKNRLPFVNETSTREEEESAALKRLDGSPLSCPSNCPGALWKIISKACAYDQSQRYAGMDDFRSALVKWAEINMGKDAIGTVFKDEKIDDVTAPSSKKSGAPAKAAEKRFVTLEAIRKQLSIDSAKKLPAEKGGKLYRKWLFRASCALAIVGVLLILAAVVQVMKSTKFESYVPGIDGMTLYWDGGDEPEWEVRYSVHGMKKPEIKTLRVSAREATLEKLLPDTKYDVSVHDKDGDEHFKKTLSTLSAPVFDATDSYRVKAELFSCLATDGDLSSVVKDKAKYKALSLTKDDLYEIDRRSVRTDTQETVYFIKLSFGISEAEDRNIACSVLLRLANGGTYVVSSDILASGGKAYIINLNDLWTQAYDDCGAWSAQKAQLQVYGDHMLIKSYDLKIVVPSYTDATKK